MNFSHLPDIFALAINEQISYAAHVAVVEQRSPHLGGEDEASLIFWQASQVQLIIQVQNLTLARSGVRRAQRVDRNGTSHLGMRPVSRRHSRRGLVGASTLRSTPISRSPLEKNPMPGHILKFPEIVLANWDYLLHDKVIEARIPFRGQIMIKL